MYNKKVLVLGGGITGLGAAWRLTEKGVNVEVIEAKKNEIGGLSSTIKKGPYRLDYGPHFFLSERPKLVEKITGLSTKNCQRLNEAHRSTSMDDFITILSQHEMYSCRCP